MATRVFKRIRSRINRQEKLKGEIVQTETDKGHIDYQGPFTKEDLWVAQPRFRDVSPENRTNLLIKHLRLCCVIFDFNDESSKENVGKEMKRQLLLAVVDHITTMKNWFNEAVCKEMLSMIAMNIFRDLPVPARGYDPEEDDPVLDPAWPHLQIVYEFLLRFMVSTYTDTKVLKKFIDKRFLTCMIGLFRSEDTRERDYLKTILHRVYGKFMSFRSFIRQAVNNVFYNYVYDSHSHSGVSELLEILGSIINGFAVPLKAEHRRFLRMVLIPLHKVKHLGSFHQQLTYCVTQFIEKDPKLGSEVLMGMFQYWPLQSSSKELLFLNEVDEILELTDKTEIQKIAIVLFTQIGKSIESPHFQVSERALFLLNNDNVAGCANELRHDILPVIYPTLARNSKGHWNPTVHSLTNNVLEMFVNLDTNLMSEVIREYDKKYQQQLEQKAQREQFWQTFSARAAAEMDDVKEIT